MAEEINSVMDHIYFVNAHPDDLLAVIGTALKLKATGRYRLHVVDATKGENGLTGVASPEECARLRDAEEREVCARLGTSPVWLSEHDGSAFASEASCRALAELYAAEPPVAIFTLWPLDRHLDHMMSASIALNALRMASGNTRGVMKTGWPEVFFFHFRNSMACDPECFVPFTEAEMAEKCEIISLYKCQQGPRMAEEEKVRNAHFGTRVRVPYAEALTRLQPLSPEKTSVLAGIAYF